MPKQHAFTLIELLVVVAIIGILAAITIPNWQNALMRAKVGRAYSDMQAISRALGMYRMDYSNFPLASNLKDTVMLPHNLRLKPLTTPVVYISRLPDDVFRLGTTYSYIDKYSWDKTDRYEASFSGGLEIRFFTGSAWVLSSVGPTGNRPDMSNGYGWEDAYDASNGLFSFGAIFLFGS